MPTYQYRCKECGADLEAVQKFTDDALTTCPACGAEALRKVYNAVGVHFKGSGFYRTDSRAKDTKSASPATSPSKDGGGGAKTDTASSSSTASSTASSGGGSTTK